MAINFDFIQLTIYMQIKDSNDERIVRRNSSFIAARLKLNNQNKTKNVFVCFCEIFLFDSVFEELI